MKTTFNEKLIAYLTLLSGLSISAVAVYYSVIGLTAIFSAAFIPVIIMGVTLEISKLIATLWLKQNWNIAPSSVKAYLMSAIAVLMLITSMGIFGFLSKAHSDQSLVSGDVLAKIAVYDERIKTEKENIEAARKALKQMDEGVDQILGRSTTETGADKAVALRKSQQKERARLQTEISQSQKLITELNNARAPIAAEIRKVEAEVGPLKYIAAFVYGETDKTVLEKAVTWVIIIIVIVFDPLAVVLLLASQYSFQNFRERQKEVDEFYELNQAQRDFFKLDDSEIPSDMTLDDIEKDAFIQKQISDIWKAIDQPCSKCGTAMTYSPNVGISCPNVDCGKETETIIVESKFDEDHIEETSKESFDLNDHPYLNQAFKYPDGWKFEPPMVYKPEESTEGNSPEKESDVVSTATVTEQPLFVQNEEQTESSLWTSTNVVVQNDPIINEVDYRNISKEKLEERINYYAGLLRERRINAVEIPVEIIQEVKARV